MDLIRWSPLKDLDDFFNQYNKGYFPQSSLLGESATWRPAASIVENEKEYLIKADLPGVEKEDIDVNVEHGVLTISGERRVEKSSDEEKQHRRESFYGSFTRSFSLPDDVNEGEINAETKGGVLRVHLPKTKVGKKSSVSIKVG